jgi:transcriptional regulator with XRE-family HTH domain
MRKKDNYRNSVELRNDMIDLSILLRNLRESKGMTHRSLSAASGVTASHICNIENKKTTVSFVMISKLFNALGYCVADAYAQIESREVVVD